MKTTKTGGRQKGTPNRITKELRIVLKNILHSELENIAVYLEKLEPKERLEILVKLMPYALPKIEMVHYKENEPSNYWDD
ncbi:hypothetical protein [Marinifilum flexuosum]|uniref:Uncharacterized protein n=1 Tax=Marinifilum flexuosum TaxID=1117708 RepID=A0A419X9L7_9BACT|nr:hypothetical protein [Marinifilum flexuosum]RKE04431.1 hypothetical protein BXY64_1451 [Marinifilum flexuosum]